MTLMRLEIGVAAAHRQTVGFAYGGMGHDFQPRPALALLLHHRLDDPKLLEVLFTKDRQRWTNQIEQSRDNLAHAWKMRGAEGVLKARLGCCGWQRRGFDALIGRVHREHVRGEDD